MAARHQLILPFVCLAVLGRRTAAQQVSCFQTSDDIEHFTAFYYRHPQPELIPDLFSALHPTGVSDRPNARPPFIAFFAEVFAANPDRVNQWQALIAQQDIATRLLLYRALSLSKAGGALSLEGHSASLNDMYWGAFGATGRIVFLQKLVDQLRYWDERDDEGLFFVGATAKWSLASNAQTDSVVHTTLQGQALTADQRTRELIDELLQESPARVKQEIADVVRQQRAAGKWPQYPNR